MSSRDDILKQFVERAMNTPREVQRMIRIGPNIGDGVTLRTSEVTVLKDGAFQTLHIKERRPLDCGHLALAAVVCQLGAEEGFAEHTACSDDARTCGGCSTAGCSRHIGLAGEQWLCAPCGRKAELDSVGQRILGGIWGLLE